MLVTFNLASPNGADHPGSAPVSVSDVRLFDSFMNARDSQMMGALVEVRDSMSDKFQSWREEWLEFGEHLDVADHSTAVRVLEQQAKLTGQSLHFQFTLQTAESVRHGFKTLYQQQA